MKLLPIFAGMILRKNIRTIVGKLFLISACIFSSGSLYAQNYYPPQSGTRDQNVTLRPVDTGRSITFRIDTGDNYDRLAIKTNLLYAATLTPNLGFEVGLTPKTTLEAAFGYNGWGKPGPESEKRLWNHFLAKVEYRYWFTERFDRHFVGADIFYLDYNIGKVDLLPSLLFEKEYYYDGYAVGGSLSYGYRWRWSERWGMEFNIAAGIVYMQYNKTLATVDQVETIRYQKFYFGPTAAGIKLFYMIM